MIPRGFSEMHLWMFTWQHWLFHLPYWDVLIQLWMVFKDEQVEMSFLLLDLEVDDLKIPSDRLGHLVGNGSSGMIWSLSGISRTPFIPYAVCPIYTGLYIISWCCKTARCNRNNSKMYLFPLILFFFFFFFQAFIHIFGVIIYFWLLFFHLTHFVVLSFIFLHIYLYIMLYSSINLKMSIIKTK